MSTLQQVLRDEITRLAHRAVRTSKAAVTPKVTGALRRDVAALKREVAALRTELNSLTRQIKRALPEQAPAPKGRAWISSKGVASLRKSLGITQAELGTLVGCSPVSIYNWEQGARPSAKHAPALIALRGLGRKQVRARLEQMGSKAT